MKKTIVWILIAVLLFTAGCGSKTSDWQEQYDLGVRYLSEGNYEEAILAFTAAIEIDPKRADAYVALAEVYVKQEKPEKAAEVIENAIGQIGKTEELTGLLEEVSQPQGPRTERVEFDDGVYQIEEYDGSGNIVKETVYNAGEVSHWRIYEYDSNGNCVKATRYNATGTVYEVIEYDSNGNSMKDTWYTADGTIDYWVVYEYNSSGNEVKTTWYHANGTFFRFTSTITAAIM